MIDGLSVKRLVDAEPISPKPHCWRHHAPLRPHPGGHASHAVSGSRHPFAKWTPSLDVQIKAFNLFVEIFLYGDVLFDYNPDN
jgi:hypothetical protein